MESSQHWRRMDCPPPLGDVLHVHRLDGNEVLTCVILSDKMEGFLTHWSGRKTVRCRQPKGLCEGCGKGLATRWVGFLHCTSTELKGAFALELTPLAGHTIKDYLDEHGSIRGCVCVVTRQRKTKKAPLVINITGRMEGLDALPKARTCEPTALRLYGNSM